MCLLALTFNLHPNSVLINFNHIDLHSKLRIHLQQSDINGGCYFQLNVQTSTDCSSASFPIVSVIIIWYRMFLCFAVGEEMKINICAFTRLDEHLGLKPVVKAFWYHYCDPLYTQCFFGVLKPAYSNHSHCMLHIVSRATYLLQVCIFSPI